MDTMLKIHENGHSRVPVYRDKRENIVGMLLVKRLMVLDAAEYAVTYAAPCCPDACCRLRCMVALLHRLFIL